MEKSILEDYIRLILLEKNGKSKKIFPTVTEVPDFKTFTELSRKIVGNSLTLSSDINEIAAAATVNKGSPVNAADVTIYAPSGGASAVIISRFGDILARAKKAGLGEDEASLYIAGEIARGSAMGMAALKDSGGGEAYWTADRGDSLQDFVDGEVSKNNPTDFLVVTPSGPIGYSAKSTAAAATNFKNPGLKDIEDLAGLEGGVAGGDRAPEIMAVYQKYDKRMNRVVPGYASMSRSEKKKYRDVAQERGFDVLALSEIRDVLLAGIQATLAGRGGERIAREFLRKMVPELPNPPYKVVYGSGLESAVIKPPSGTVTVALHAASPRAKIVVEPSGNNGIKFSSTDSRVGKIFTYRIKFESSYGTSLKGAVTA